MTSLAMDFLLQPVAGIPHILPPSLPSGGGEGVVDVSLSMNRSQRKSMSMSMSKKRDLTLTLDPKRSTNMLSFFCVFVEHVFQAARPRVFRVRWNSQWRLT